MRLSYLDSSRGLAALIVLLSHYQPTILPVLNDSWILKTPLNILADGKAAVLYFFILSGYVLTLSLQNNNQLSISDYLRFVVKRLLRIFPAFFLTLLLSYIILFIVQPLQGSWLHEFWKSPVDLFSAFKQAILIVRLPNDPLFRLVPQDWTLSIEIAVSLLLPALAFSIKNKSLMSLLFIYLSVKFLSLDPFVFDFSLGIYLACNHEKSIETWKKTKLKFFLIVISIIIISSDYIFPEFMNYADLILVHHKTWGLLIILWAIISTESVQNILSVKPLNFLGKISYSFYLLHFIILLVLSVVFPALNPITFLLLLLSITIVGSTITYYFIERPFNKLGKVLFEK